MDSPFAQIFDAYSWVTATKWRWIPVLVFIGILIGAILF